MDVGDIYMFLVVNVVGLWVDCVVWWVGFELLMWVMCEQEIVFEIIDVGGLLWLCYFDMVQVIYYWFEGQIWMLVGWGFFKEYEYVDFDGYDEQVDKEFIEDVMI